MSESDILHALEDTQFPQKLRGYDPAEVDDLIDRASREIADLRAELARAIAAERAALDDMQGHEEQRQVYEAELEELRRLIDEADEARRSAVSHVR